MTKRILLILLFFVLDLSSAKASHIVGGDFAYSYLGDTIVSGQVLMKYRVRLFIYQDCITGVADAIKEDNPAHFTLYENNGSPFALNIDTNIRYNLATGAITVPANFSNDCINKVPQLCLLRKEFVKTYFLRPNASGYLIAYQRCCRNQNILNIVRWCSDFQLFRRTCSTNLDILDVIL